MAIEIERKFLVDMDLLPELENGLEIKQGYIHASDEKVVRVRTKGKKAFLTIKGSNMGISRLEYEYEISVNEANEMLDNLCEESIIDKKRFLIPHGNHTWELDIFYGQNDGLVIAEIELNDENEEFLKPNWIKEEVSHEAKYYNSNLMKNPYKNWKDK